MSPEEFSEQFDIYYNNITSNQAPGLNEYEKSVFLTQAQYEVVLAYLNPKGNKFMEGYDGSARRQVDFSRLTAVLDYGVFNTDMIDNEHKPSIKDSDWADIPDGKLFYADVVKAVKDKYISFESGIPKLRDADKVDFDFEVTYLGGGNSRATFTHKFKTGGVFDNKDETKQVIMPSDILSVINERVVVTRGGKEKELVVIPIDYMEYNRLSGKVYQRPLKNHAWRLTDLSISGYPINDIIVGINDKIVSYTIRYVKRPNPIITSDLGDTKIDGRSTVTECELDPIMHPDILLRAVELAKASYTGNLPEMVQLGQVSHTNMGIISPSKE